MISTKEELLREMASLVRQEGGLRAGVPVNVNDLLRVDMAPGSRKRLDMLLVDCEGVGWLTPVSAQDGLWNLTQLGVDQVHELEEHSAAEASLGPIERWFRKESRVHGMTWSTLLQLGTLAIAAAALIISIWK